MEKVSDDLLGINPPKLPSAPPPPPPVPPAPDAAAAADRSRAMRQQEDAKNKKRGRASTVVTGPEGVGATPLGIKTLVGS